MKSDATGAGGQDQDGRNLQVALRAGDCRAAEGTPHHEVMAKSFFEERTGCCRCSYRRKVTVTVAVAAAAVIAAFLRSPFVWETLLLLDRYLLSP